MPIANIATGTLEGRFYNQDLVTPAAGQVELIPSVNLVRDLAGNVLVSGRIKVTLRGDGSFSQDVLAYDAESDPKHVTWTAVPKLKTGHLRAIEGIRVNAGATVQLADVVSVDPEAPQYAQQVTIEDLNEARAVVDAAAEAAAEAAAAVAGKVDQDQLTGAVADGVSQAVEAAAEDATTKADAARDDAVDAATSASVPLESKGAGGGVAPLDDDAHVPDEHLPVRLSPSGLANTFATRWHVVAILGQSNAGGRGEVDPTGLDAVDSRIFQYPVAGFYEGAVVPAVEPLGNFDVVSVDLSNGLGPAGSFARWLLQGLPANHRVLLVPLAYGSIGFSTPYPLTWDAVPDGGLFDQAVFQINSAMNAVGADATLDAFVWVQGEADIINGVDYLTYRDYLDSLIDGFRADVDAASPTTPFIVGCTAPENYNNYVNGPGVDWVHRSTPSRKLHTAVVVPNPATTFDGLHYTAEVQRRIGKDMALTALPAAVALTSLAPAPPLPEIPSGAQDTFNRANSATTLNPASDGGSWIALLGTWGISGNAAYRPVGAGGFDLAVRETSLANCHITWTVGEADDSCFIFRVADASNYHLITTGDYYRMVGNSFEYVANNMGITDGATVEVILAGTSITIKVNGAAKYTGTSSFNQAATRHGLSTQGGGAARFDSFSVVP